MTSIVILALFLALAPAPEAPPCPTSEVASAWAPTSESRPDLEGCVKWGEKTLTVERFGYHLELKEECDDRKVACTLTYSHTCIKGENIKTKTKVRKCGTKAPGAFDCTIKNKCGAIEEDKFYFSVQTIRCVEKKKKGKK